VRAVFRILGTHRDGDIAFRAHGGVGTLLLCKLLDAHISRGRDQPFQKDTSSLSNCQATHEFAADRRGLIFNFALATRYEYKQMPTGEWTQKQSQT
jgi:broad specificity phosphatase PhoE